MRYRSVVLALAVGALALVAAGCGGDDGRWRRRRGQRGRHRLDLRDGDLGGEEQESFQAVIDGFEAKLPERDVKYTSGGDNLAPLLSTAVEGGNPPDIAAIGQPGLMADFAEQGRDQADRRPSRHDRGRVRRVGGRRRRGRRHAVRRHVQGRQQVDHLVQRRGLRGGRGRAARDVGRAQRGRDTLKAAGITPYSVGVDVGWPITDLFENVYIRTAGPEKYDQLAKHEIPWTDQSVKDALTVMQDIVGDSDNLAGGTGGALQTEMPDSVAKVFSDDPEASMVVIGDFASRRHRDDARAGDGLQRLHVPVDRGLRARRWSAAATSSSSSRTARPRTRSSST